MMICEQVAEKEMQMSSNIRKDAQTPVTRKVSFFKKKYYFLAIELIKNHIQLEKVYKTGTFTHRLWEHKMEQPIQRGV